MSDRRGRRAARAAKTTHTADATDAACGEFKTFPIPMYGQYSASNCMDFGGVGCGQPAADNFCKKEGFARASAFKVGYGAPMPWVPGSSKACNDPGCVRLENVTCVRP